MPLSYVYFSDECRQLEFKAVQVFHGQRLKNHLIRSAEVLNKEFCGVLCFMESKCVSYNLMAENENGKYKCELNNASYEENKRDMDEDSNYVYRGAEVNNYFRKGDSRLKGFPSFDFSNTLQPWIF